MTGGQEKNFSSLGPKLRENRAQQYYGDKSLQICVETINYIEAPYLTSSRFKYSDQGLRIRESSLLKAQDPSSWVATTFSLSHSTTQSAVAFLVNTETKRGRVSFKVLVCIVMFDVRYVLSNLPP